MTDPSLIHQGGNLLLLDEPTNDLDVDTLRALEDAIDAYPGCAVIVSHDRYFLDKVATHTLAFEDDGGVVSIFAAVRRVLLLCLTLCDMVLCTSYN